MKCIFDKTIDCEINPDGPMTEDFKCLGCHKPKKEDEKDEVVKEEGRCIVRDRFFGASGGRGRKINMSKKKMWGRGRKKQ